MIFAKLLILALAGGGWGFLAAELLPPPWSLIVAIAGGIVIGVYAGPWAFE